MRADEDGSDHRDVHEPLRGDAVRARDPGAAERSRPEDADENQVDQLSVSCAHRRMLHQTTRAPAANTTSRPSRASTAPLAQRAPPHGRCRPGDSWAARRSDLLGSGLSGSASPSTTSNATTVMLSDPAGLVRGVDEQPRHRLGLARGASGERKDPCVVDHVRQTVGAEEIQVAGEHFERERVHVHVRLGADSARVITERCGWSAACSGVRRPVRTSSATSEWSAVSCSRLRLDAICLRIP